MGKAFNRRDRRFQLMACHNDEFILDLIQPFQFLAHMYWLSDINSRNQHKTYPVWLNCVLHRNQTIVPDLLFTRRATDNMNLRPTYRPARLKSSPPDMWLFPPH